MKIIRTQINKPNRRKPVYVMNQEGLSDLEKRAVLEGVQELVRLAQVGDLDIHDFGIWRQPDYKSSEGSLKSFQSVDWYVQKGRETSRNRNQLNADTMQTSLLIEPWKDTQRGGKDHYDVLIVHEDMHSQGTNFVIGLAQAGIGTVISTHRFKGLDDRLKRECVKTETMHEVGHVFGLIPDNRTENVDYSLGKHCANKCVIRQGLRLPDDWINMTKDRLRYGALCQPCQRYLKAYFK